MTERKLNLMDEMSVILEQDVAQRHSYFQLKYFLIGKEPTNQAKMWQCLRELKSRKETLKSILLEREDLKDKLELLDINAKRKMIEMEKNNPSDLSFREMEITLRQIGRQIQSLRESLLQLDDRQKWIEEESMFFFRNIQKFTKN